MLTLLDHLYNCGFDGELSRWLLPEEKLDHRVAQENCARLWHELEIRLSQGDRALLERLKENLSERGEEGERLSFRRGLALGLKLGALASWAP